MNDNFDQQRLGNASQVFGSTSDDTALPFKDKYTTEEQKQRDTEVTRLLAAYVKTYEKKTERNGYKNEGRPRCFIFRQSFINSKVFF